MAKKIGEKKNEETTVFVQDENMQSTPVVGIGASAGGLEALEKFFHTIPPNTGAAYVIIQHLDPNHKSILVDLIKRYTKMEVYQIINGVNVEPNTVYIIPPGSDVIIKNNKLILTLRAKPRVFRMPIDRFLKSLANDKKDNAIAVILSGTGADGALGVRDIKSENGIVFAQAPEDAKYEGMPQRAINTGLVDYILDADKMSEKLLTYIQSIFDFTESIPITEDYGINILSKIFNILLRETGHDFTSYKPNTIERRIERRMKIAQVSNKEEYVAILQKNRAEVDALFQDFLIGVTQFFRDSGAFKYVYDNVIPELFSKANENAPIRIWMPGCSTGEEVYTMGMLFKEYMLKNSLGHYKVQIFATDIDKNALDKARQAYYPDSISIDVPEHYLNQYFSLEENNYLVNKSLRDMIVFAEQSIAKDPPFSRVDLISCRNLLIYMNSNLQKKIIATFHYALNPNGFLFLGSSETIGKNRNLFTTKDNKWKLYKKNNVLSNNVYDLPSFYPAKRERNQIIEKPIVKEKITLKSIAENEIIENFTPAAAIIDNKFDILYLKGETATYLQPVKGVISVNIIDMAKPDIRIKLSIALNKAVRENKKIIEEKLYIKTDNHYKFINIHIKPIEPKNDVSNLFLVVFEDITEKELFTDDIAISFSDKNTNYIKVIEEELKNTKSYLQSVIEVADSTTEELKATNEELQSSNEELQSTNEELETSKEELQSINEELIAVNSEHQKKIGELSDMSNDISNLLTKTNIATIFFDLDSKIKKFTPQVKEFVELMNADIDRPIKNFSTGLNYPDFQKDILHVIHTLNTIEKEIENAEKSFICRIMPYLTIDNEVTGVVITFVDVAELKKTKRALRESEKLLEKKSRIAQLGSWDFDPKTTKITWSKETYRIHEVPLDFVPNLNSVIGFYIPEHQSIIRKLVDKSIHMGKSFTTELMITTHNGNQVWVRTMGEAVYESNEIIKISGTIQNINQQKLALLALKESEKKYKIVFENSSDVIIIHDLDMNIMNINSQAIKEFGYSKDEFLQQKFFDLHALDELSFAKEVLKQLENKDLIKVETKFRRKDDSVFLAETILYKYELDNHPLVHTVIRNNTAQKS
ncbi:PAS domain S-box protein [Polaribacter litorisediminis]|uniref:chemotaxis protein CheB n=1 Tax=Polaribacter litorisediminis TaxID=1908341 RepID=UPI001CBEE96C|nr:chemotaxis protein CheB [Polaribacter litorisediminis]UAM97521.1 PAS domain S-box protein [Polaribacter litorisediminis]